MAYTAGTVVPPPLQVGLQVSSEWEYYQCVFGFARSEWARWVLQLSQMLPTRHGPAITHSQAEVDRFILDRVESVPHLEALLLVWRARPQTWSAEAMARRLWVKPEVAKRILDDLERDNFLIRLSGKEKYACHPDTETDPLLDAVYHSYRREMIRISTMIHSKASTPIREFARAFRLKKEPEEHGSGR